MAKPPAGEFWFLADPQWQEWVDGFPVYTLLVAKDLTGWRRKVEIAVRRPFPNAPLSPSDKALVLTILTHHADRIKASTGAKSGTIAILTSMTAVAAFGALLFHPLAPVAAVLGAITGATAAWDVGLGSSAGNAAVHDLLTETAEKLP